MFIKVKDFFFIDTLNLELVKIVEDSLFIVLKDDKGNVCLTKEILLEKNQKNYKWEGLGHLPYGVYYLEIGADEKKKILKAVKRV